MALESGVSGRDRQVVVGAKSIKKVENVKKKKKRYQTPPKGVEPFAAE